MNNIDELIEIIKSMGDSATFGEICDAYQIKYKDSLSGTQKSVINHTLEANSDKVFYDSEKNRWFLYFGEEKIQNSQPIDDVISYVVSLFENGQLTVNNRDYHKKGNKLFRIAIPSDKAVCEILVSSRNYKIYSNKQLNELKQYFYKNSKAKNEHRPYQYHIPVK